MDNLRRTLFATSASDIPKDFNPGSQYNDELIEALYVPLYKNNTLNGTSFTYVPYSLTGKSYESLPNLYIYSSTTNLGYNIAPYPNNRNEKGYSIIYPEISGIKYGAYTNSTGSGYSLFLYKNGVTLNNYVTFNGFTYIMDLLGADVLYILVPLTNALLKSLIYIKPHSSETFPSDWYYKPYTA